ncbi:hypothetical protein N7494_005006 [Penicillium frequentans]|uniref:Uncharacterized protein n=1 Tax=Penicillium frequentans TaxID=3151616 RepID=A0AAD6D3S2_9EURO|nr:hypothetical protein N7494_005006 [Penicillium glabrum]
MHFSTTVAILAVAAGVQAAKRAEPPVHERVARGGAAGTAAAGTAAAGTAVRTGTHPIMTGAPAHNGTTNGTVPTSSSAGHSSIALIPSSTRSAGAGASSSAGSSSGSGTGSGTGTGTGSSSGSGSSSGAGSGTGSSSGSGSSSGAGSGAGSSNTPASPSSTGFNPTNAGANVHPMGVAGVIVGGAAYGLMLL